MHQATQAEAVAVIQTWCESLAPEKKIWNAILGEPSQLFWTTKNFLLFAYFWWYNVVQHSSCLSHEADFKFAAESSWAGALQFTSYQYQIHLISWLVYDKLITMCNVSMMSSLLLFCLWKMQVLPLFNSNLVTLMLVTKMCFINQIRSETLHLNCKLRLT